MANHKPTHGTGYLRTVTPALVAIQLVIVKTSARSPQAARLSRRAWQMLCQRSRIADRQRIARRAGRRQNPPLLCTHPGCAESAPGLLG